MTNGDPLMTTETDIEKRLSFVATACEWTPSAIEPAHIPELLREAKDELRRRAQRIYKLEYALRIAPAKPTPDDVAWAEEGLLDEEYRERSRECVGGKTAQQWRERYVGGTDTENALRRWLGGECGDRPDAVQILREKARELTPPSVTRVGCEEITRGYIGGALQMVADALEKERNG